MECQSHMVLFCRRIVGKGLAFVFLVGFSSLAHAQRERIWGRGAEPRASSRSGEDEQETVSAFEFAQEKSGYSKNDLTEEIKTLNKEETVLKTPIDRTKVREIERKVSASRAESDFLKSLKSQFSNKERLRVALSSFDPAKMSDSEEARMTSAGRSVKEAKEALSGFQNQLKAREGYDKYQEIKGKAKDNWSATDKENLEGFEGKAKELLANIKSVTDEIASAPEKVQVLESNDPTSPFQLVGSLRTDSQGKQRLALSVQLKDNAKDKINSGVLEKISVDELKEKLGVVTIKPIELGKDASQFKAKASEPNAVDSLREDIAASVEKRVDREIGAKDDSSTEIGKLEEQKNDLLDTKTKKENLLNIALKKKIAEWLKKNKGEGLEPCQIVARSINGGQNDTLTELQWAQIPQDTRQQCLSLDPKKRFEVEDMRKRIETDGLSAQEAQKAVMAEIIRLANQCDAMKREQARMESNTKQITDVVEKAWEALVISGSTSELLTRVLTDEQGGINLSDPDLYELSSLSTITTKTAQSVPKDKKGNEKLEREREALSVIMRLAYRKLERAGAALAMAQRDPVTGMGIGPTGYLDPARLNVAGDTVAKMGRLFNSTKALIDAIDIEIGARDAANQARLRGGAAPAGGGGAVGAQPAPTNTGDNPLNYDGIRPADQRRMNLNRKNQGKQPKGNRPPYINR